MEEVSIKSKAKIARTDLKYQRYLINNINLKNRLIALKGARGTGKTTLLLQLAKKLKTKNVLYVALDDLFFTQNTLYSLAESFLKKGGELLLLDEVHKYPNWSRELKLIYDDFPDLKVIFTSSSILDIYKGESDLSRRMVSYKLQEMSFREYLQFYEKIDLPSFSLEEIIENHSEISLEIIQNFKPFQYFSKFLSVGKYPYYEGDAFEYHQKLRNTVNLILDIDLQSIESIEYKNIAKFKKLLFILATNAPYTPNISDLSKKIELNRNALVKALQLLEKADLLHTAIFSTKSMSIMNKPDKIWLHNTNLSYAIQSGTPDIGNLRETFFISQLRQKHKVDLAKKGDFIVDEKYTFEIGGKNKNKKQIVDLPNAFLAKDDIEIGIDNSIPLWLFGFLY